MPTDPGLLSHPGQDRTGWAAAALLPFLGLSVDVVMGDSLASDVEVRRAFESLVDDFLARGGAREVIEPKAGVEPSDLDVAIEVMLADHGSIGGSLSEGLGLGPDVRSGSGPSSSSSAMIEQAPAFFSPGAATAEQAG